jgi:hypothetical protein
MFLFLRDVGSPIFMAKFAAYRSMIIPVRCGVPIQITSAIGRYEIDWDQANQLLSLSERMHDCLVRLGADFGWPPVIFIDWLQDHASAIARDMHFHAPDFQVHLQRLFGS